MCQYSTIRVELTCLSKGICAAEQTSYLAILDIHTLADMYDRSISDKHIKIRHMLGAMCANLTHHLKSVSKLCNDTRCNTKILIIKY